MHPPCGWDTLVVGPAATTDSMQCTWEGQRGPLPPRTPLSSLMHVRSGTDLATLVLAARSMDPWQPLAIVILAFHVSGGAYVWVSVCERVGGQVGGWGGCGVWAVKVGL